MGRFRCAPFAGILLAWIPGTTTARTPSAPVRLELQLDASQTLSWELTAAGDARVVAVGWETAPASLWTEPPFQSMDLAAGETVHGRMAVGAADAWISARLVVRDALGEWTVGASVRTPSRRPVPPIPVAPISKTTSSSASRVRATFHYEDRIVDRRGYSGTVQTLPLRYVDADLVAEDGRVLARSGLDARGQVELGPVPANAGPVRVRLHTSTRLHPTYRIDVVEPRGPQSGLDDVLPHTIVTEPVVVDGAEVDLGTLLVRDPDGFGRVQAFHILDNALDAWEALADPEWFGSAPGTPDSLRIFWGPTLRLRGSAYGRGLIELASPGSGDTDGWSDAVILHEVGHFVAQRFLRDDTPGGIHLLGDVHQDPRLAFSEGFASAFACYVRARRAVTRHNVAGAAMDTDVASFVNAGMPPPDGASGGLQYVWDIEAHTLGGAPLVREGIESETNLAGVWLDLVDTAASPSGADDERVHAPLAAMFEAFRSLRTSMLPSGATFEDFWRAWSERNHGGELQELLRAARIDYELDLAEPDVAPREPPALWSAVGREVPGEVVIAEIWTAPAVAVELVNRRQAPVPIGGWQLLARSNDASQNPSLTYTIPPSVVLGPGARLLVVRSGRPHDDTATTLHAPGWTVPWFPGFDGALGLRDASGRGIDFVRWDARNGTAPSRIAPIAGTTWNGNLVAATPGHSLARRSDRGDADRADEFTDAEPTPGGPNDAPGVHRTFFPADDVDRLQWWIRDAGTYTIQARRLRNGALPEIEVRSLEANTSVVRARATNGRDDARITLALRAGETIEARFRHVGTMTRLGTYDVAAWREPGGRVPLPPTGVTIVVGSGASPRAVTCSWWNAAQYDSLCVRVGGIASPSLAGDARAAVLTLPEGRHELEVVGWTGGVAAASPVLAVAVETWPQSFVEHFEPWPNVDWETNGWGTLQIEGRGAVLTDSPTGDYADDRTTTVRMRAAVVPTPDAVLRFDHVCAVRPEDGAWVEVSDDWGASWSSLARYDWRTRTPAGGDWSDRELVAADWVAESLPLAAFAGRPIQIRFRLASDIYAHADGWFVDAVTIGAPPAPPRLVLRLAPNLPNPFNPSTAIRFEVSQPAPVMLRILDVRGRVVRTLFDAPIAAGAHAILWDGRDTHGHLAASGVYFSELRGPDARAARTLVLLR